MKKATNIVLDHSQLSCMMNSQSFNSSFSSQCRRDSFGVARNDIHMYIYIYKQTKNDEDNNNNNKKDVNNEIFVTVTLNVISSTLPPEQAHGIKEGQLRLQREHDEGFA